MAKQHHSTQNMATFFENQSQFREWLENNHDQETALVVGFHKVGSGKPSMSWSESVDQALCFGWIDGVRKSIDEDSYCIRFTPRKRNSIWSAVNIKKMEALIQAGLMRPEGLSAFSHRKEERSEIYSYEKESTALAPDYLRQFEQHAAAWDFFLRQAPSYQKAIVHWIMDAKQEQTRQSRLEKTIAASEAQKRLR
jgi:uncharacterized protein YdeI (YjbR/CyaY-like superfamily)